MFRSLVKDCSPQNTNVKVAVVFSKDKQQRAEDFTPRLFLWQNLHSRSHLLPRVIWQAVPTY
nr:MAG TPA: hypothetical protein [Caudoviricetes sp.]DAZ85207.1 MAG TPA: hypothetical protein [Caudoviricetes sp.]